MDPCSCTLSLHDERRSRLCLSLDAWILTVQVFSHTPKHVTITYPEYQKMTLISMVLINKCDLLCMADPCSGKRGWRRMPRINPGMRRTKGWWLTLPQARLEKEGRVWRRETRGGGRTGSTFVCISSHNRKRPVASPSQWLCFCSPPPACFPGGGGGGGRGGVERQAPKTAG